MLAQITIIGVLTITLILFLHGRWRHDVVALFALLLSVFLGLVPSEEAFAGFSHPAVITVACVLILSGSLQQTGVVDVLAKRILPSKSGPTLSIAALASLGALLSSFMNNVGALALLMPIALQISNRQQLSPGKILLPLSLGTMLGGTTTLIGTPSNLIVSSFRTQPDYGFAMFDFTPVGIAITLVGIIFISIIGWRIVPSRERAGADSFNTAAYITEARLDTDSKAIGMTLREAEAAMDSDDAQIISMIRNNIRLITPHPATKLQEDDILLIEAEPDSLADTMQSLGLVFHEEIRPEDKKKNEETDKTKTQNASETQPEATLQESVNSSDENPEGKEPKNEKKSERPTALEDFELVEIVVLPGSNLSGRTARNINMRQRFGVNLLAISRQGARIQSRVRSTMLRYGDVLLMQGPNDLITEFASSSGCAPLAARSIRSPDRKKMITSLSIMLLSISLAALNIMPAAVSFSLGVLLVMVTRVLPLRRIYSSIDWPVIVLLGALLPVAQAMESTGAANLIANGLLEYVAQGNSTVALVLILILTMLMTDVVNNAATAAIMSPVAIGAAGHLGINSDPFLMAVAIASSCAFMTPIGHQNNTLIMGPAGFRFTDYWPLGLPLAIIVVLVSVPTLLYIWPVS